MRNKDVLNHLIQAFDLKSYLEIGVRDCSTFEQVICQEKFAVDPAPQKTVSGENVFFYVETSDSFFKRIPEERKFDLIFIDGDHSFDFVKRDLENSINHISKNGVIVLHDTDPPFEKLQGVPKLAGGPGSKNICGPMGECWKALVERRIKNQDIKVMTVKCDEKSFSAPETPGTGCESGMSMCRIVEQSVDLSEYANEKLEWKLLESNRDKLLNRVTFEEMKDRCSDFFN
jgi:hypothetical protein